MKHLKRFLSVFLAVALLFPGAMPKASAHGQESVTGEMHPFYGTEQLIEDAVHDLHEQGITVPEAEIDRELIADVEKDSKKTYNEVKTEVMTRLQENLGSGEIDVADLNLDKPTFRKVMDDILESNYLTHAISGMTYSSKDSKVEGIRFDVSEGYQSAMDAMEEEENTPLRDYMESAMKRLPEFFEDLISRVPVRYQQNMQVMAADGAPACRNHTVAPAQLLGDMNGDHRISVRDVSVIRGLIAESKFDAIADMNKDQKVDQADVDLLREMILEDNTPEAIGAPSIQFNWALQQDFTPRDAKGQPTMDPQQIANGGLLYGPDPATGVMTIQQGILPDIYWGLESISFTCAKCGHEIVLKRDAQNPQNPMNAALDQMVTRYNVYVDTVTHKSTQVEITQPQPEVTDTFMLYTQVSVAQYVDDSFRVDETGTPVMGPNGMPVGLYISAGDQYDNMAAQIDFYYSMFSMFNADNADYLGVSARYWTTKNSDADPLAAIKSLCNIPLDIPMPPAMMAPLIQMLPQAFMAYVMYYGDQLTAMKQAAKNLMDSLPSNTTMVQKMLVLHDWVAENAKFDMGAMMELSESNGNPETDPIQMTAFGALLSNQLAAAPPQPGKSVYGGCICLGYAAAYNLLLQEFVYPEIYKNSDGSWKTPGEVGENDRCDFGQVMFYANTVSTSIAGEGFGGGFFNNVHYYNLVRVPDAPQTGGDKDNPRQGDWFFVDVCYDDIFMECMSQYRAEADGAIHHDFFLVSPITMNKIWGDSVDFISNLHDGVEFKVKVDRQGNPVPYPKEDELHYNKKDPNHPMHVTVPARNEVGSDNTCYEDSWFSGAVSSIEFDGENWYYVDSENTNLVFADMIEKDSDGNYHFNFEEMIKHDTKTGIHGVRASKDKQCKMKSRPMNAVDYWEEEKDNNSQADRNQMKEYKKDPYAVVLLNYGTGDGKHLAADPELVAAVKEHYTYTDQYPGLTLCLGLYENKLYFNLGAKIYTYDLSTNTCQAVKGYADVHASSDGRKFTASSYYLDPDGTALNVQDNPIAGMAVRTAYIPQFAPRMDAEGQPVVDAAGQPVYYCTHMQEQEVMTVNIGTNYSFTAAFKNGASDADNMATVYTAEAINFNGDFSQNLDINMPDEKRDPNSNKEFLWCANIRDEFPMAGFEPEAIPEKVIPCSAQDHGHDYVYDSAQEMYICSNCNLHAKNIVEEHPDFTVTMHHDPDSGLDEAKNKAKDQPKTVVPVNDVREAAVLAGGKIKKDKLDGGVIQVEVTPNSEDITKKVLGIQYQDYKNSEPVTVTEKNENGMYVIQKPAVTAENNGCMSVRLLTEDAFRIISQITPDGKATVTPDKATAKPGERINVHVEPAIGYAVKRLSVTAVIDGEEMELPFEKKEQSSNDIYFDMPSANVKVIVEVERVYKINISQGSEQFIMATRNQAPAGAYVQLIPTKPEYNLTTLTVTMDKDGSRVPLDAQNRFKMPAGNVTVTAEIGPVQPATRYLNVVGGVILGGDDPAMHEGQFAPETDVTVSAVIPEKKGFVRWDAEGIKLSEEDAKKATLTFKMPNADVKLTAVLEDLYTVTYTDGVEDEVIFGDYTYERKYGAATPHPFNEGSNPARAGYAFDGWAPEVAETVTADVTYVAQWTKLHTVTYTDGVEDEEIFADQVTHDVRHGASTPAFGADPVREGYDFKGWDKQVAETVTEDAVYTATWAKKTYTVTYTDGVENEVVFADRSFTAVEHGAETPAFGDAPTRTGYTFTGWDKELAPTVTGSVTYTATWAKETYTVTYTDGVENEEVFADKKLTVAYGDPIPAFGEAPTRSGYAFKGWTPEVAGTASGDVTYTATWAKTWTVTYKEDAQGTVLHTEVVEEGQPTPVIEEPAREGYAFKGWNPVVAETVTEDAVYVAQWVKTWTVTYVNGVDGEVIKSFVLEEGQPTPKIDDPTCEGKVFKQWTPALAPTVTEDKTYTAVWADLFTVTYTDGVEGETIFEDQKYTVEGGTATPEFGPDPAREGYIFKGWSPNVADTVTGNATYQAVWGKPTYTVTYTDGVENEEVFANKTYTVEEGEKTPSFEVPARDGYDFKGWDPEVAETVTGTATYTATWAKKTYTVTYTDGVEDAVVFEDRIFTDVEHGAATPAFGDKPTRTGYTFTGWDKELASSVTGSVTYTAQWAKETYTVTYTDGVEDAVVFEDKAVSAEYGAQTPAFGADPVRAGYTFKGWTPTVEETVTKTVTYTAVWEQDTVTPDPAPDPDPAPTT